MTKKKTKKGTRKSQFFTLWPKSLYEAAGALVLWGVLFVGAIFLVALFNIQIAGANPWLQIYYAGFLVPYLTPHGFSPSFSLYWLMSVLTPSDPLTWMQCFIVGCPTGGQWGNIALSQAVADYAVTL